jgi:hypothetical protein
MEELLTRLPIADRGKYPLKMDIRLVWRFLVRGDLNCQMPKNNKFMISILHQLGSNMLQIEHML